MTIPSDLATDYQEDFSGGQDASKKPQLVRQNGFFAGVNVSTDEGVLRPRWGWDKKQLQFPEGGVTTKQGLFKSYETIFKSGKFQAATPYSIGGQYYLSAIVSGNLFLINQDNFLVQVIPLDDAQQLNSHAPRINWSPAAQYLTYFDYPAFPVIVDGIEARRADPLEKEIPISNIGGYNQNRLFIGDAGNLFTAGDPTGNLATPNAPLTFDEISTGGAYAGQNFALNTNYNNDPITAIAYLQLSDTSTGIGPLLVATSQAIYSYNTQNPRNTWEAGQFGSILTFNAGVVGPRAITNLDSDVFFVSNDGQLRALSMSREEQKRWSKRPLSREVKNWIKAQEPGLLKYTVVNYFRNNVFMAVNPYRTTVRGLNDELLPDYAFGGFVVLELDNVSDMTTEAPPAWSGLWTGVRPMEMVVNNDRAFVFSKDGGENALYEVMPDRTYDTINGRIRKIKSRIYTKAYACGSASLKKLHSIDTELTNVKGDFKLSIRYKPDQAANFQFFGEMAHSQPWTNCRPPFFLNGLAGANFLPWTFGGFDVQNQCDPISEESYQLFKRVQLALDIEGINWELRSILVKATQDVNYVNRTACAYKSVPVPLTCANDWSIIDEGLCR